MYVIDGSLKMFAKIHWRIESIQQFNYFFLVSRIGYVDVKSSPVYFYVQRYAHFNTAKTPIPFDVEKLNVGGALDLDMDTAE